MLKIFATLAALAVLAGTSLLALALATAGPAGCPTALLQGRLVNAGGSLAVAGMPGGGITAVEWPFGYWSSRSQGHGSRRTRRSPGAAELAVTDGSEVRIGASGAGPLAFTFSEVGGTRRMEASW